MALSFESPFMFTKSIRWRLQLWLAFLLAAILSGFGVTAYQLHRNNQFQQIDQELQRRVTVLSNNLRGQAPFEGRAGHSPFGERRERPMFEEGMKQKGFRRGFPDGPGKREPMDMPPGLREIRWTAQTLSYFDETDTNGFYFLIWSHDAFLLKRSTNAPAAVPIPKRQEDILDLDTQQRGIYREAFRFTAMGDCILAGRCVAADFDTLHRFAWWLVAAGTGVLALGLGGGWRLASLIMKPVTDIGATARRISAGNLSERINVDETDNELGRLVEVLNSTFARLEAAFAQQKQFTADASHELRTPIAVLISEAQTTLARPRTADGYRETVEACLDSAQQMRRLTESLLELARFDAGQESMKRRPFDLAEITRDLVERVQPLARERGLAVQCDFAPAEVVGDPDRICQVITNLLTNAISYNRDGGEVRVRTGTSSGVPTLVVADTGLGIPAEDLPHVFERFYRGDKSRARANGHWGLGLAICKAIVDAHGGRIEVTSQREVGTRVQVQLPG
jgi:two-component system, OmpR family, sensor kinase